MLLTRHLSSSLVNPQSHEAGTVLCTVHKHARDQPRFSAASKAAEPSVEEGRRLGLATYMPAFQSWVDACNSGQSALLPSGPACHRQGGAAGAQRSDSAEQGQRRYVPLALHLDAGHPEEDSGVLGYLTPEFSRQLARFPDVFVCHASSTAAVEHVALSPTLATPSQRTEAVAEVLCTLREEGWIEGWRNELYPVARCFGDEPAFLLERAAATRFGVKTYGVHVNGYVTLEDGSQEMWVARRSLSKPTWPGKLDNIAAGGQPHGLSCFENMVKECEEEAGISAELARQARPVGVAAYTANQRLGLKRDVLFLYDLELPHDFVPQPQDGEAEGFQRLPVLEVARLVATTDQFKANCNLVLIDFLVRHSYLAPDLPGYALLLRGLRPPGCC